MLERGDTVLGDHVSLIRGTTYKSVLLGQPGPALLGLASIGRDGGFRRDSLRTYGGESSERLLLRPGDLFVSLKDVTQDGDLLGAVARVPPEVELGRLTQDTVKLDLTRSRVSANYLYWLLRTPEHREHCRIHATGTTNLGLPREDFLALPVPPLTLERAILVDMLDAIEAKVELNRKMNHTLEEMASGLFKSWFVDFDPIVAKADGRQPFGMDAATAGLFPSDFADSDLGPIPRGWKATTVGACVADVFDGPHATPPDAASGAVFLGIGNMTGTGIDLSSVRFIAESDWARWTKRVTPVEGDIVFTYEAALGRFALVPAGLRCCLGRRMALVRPGAPAHVPFLFHQFVAAPFQEVIAARSWTGSTVDRTPLTEFPDYPFLWPGDALVARFSAQAAPIWALIHHNQAESRTLTALRDTLLPKLLSGEVRLKQAETLVEAAL